MCTVYFSEIKVFHVVGYVSKGKQHWYVIIIMYLSDLHL